MNDEDKKTLLEHLKPTRHLVEFDLLFPEIRHVGRIYDCHDRYFIVAVNEDEGVFELVKYDRLHSVKIRLE